MLTAVLWATEPGAAHTPASLWKPGRTAATWDWERHWNYWMKWKCAKRGIVPGLGMPACLRWERAGRVWKPCGPTIRPPQPGRTNSCNIGRRGGHSQHGNGVTVKYTYLGRHEDRTGPTYMVCVGDRRKRANTRPGNCGTWVRTSHRHCPGRPNEHPPCTTATTAPPRTAPPRTAPPERTYTTRPSTRPSRPPTTTRPRTRPARPPATTRPRTRSTRPPTTTTTRPPIEACRKTGAGAAFRAAVDSLPTPGLGIRPAGYGYVGVPIQISYTHRPTAFDSALVDGDRIYLRVWVSEMSWSLTGLGTTDGGPTQSSTVRRSAPNRYSAPRLADPKTAEIQGREAVFLRSSAKAGYPSGYPITLRITWRAECREYGKSVWRALSSQTWRYDHNYQVYDVRSRSR